MKDHDVDALLSWLERGARPRHPWVGNHLLYRLARHVSGRDTRRYLRMFDSIPEKAEHWWVLQNLADAHALPLLRYWHMLEAKEEQRDLLLKVIVRLEDAGPQSRRSRETCCHPTPECLLSWIRALPGRGHEVEITTAEQAKAWLQGTDTASIEIRFTDSLSRIALVTRPAVEEAGRWEHLYGCWHRVPSP